MNDDRYEIKEKIGQGGIGAVYRAFDRRLKRDVAIKRVLPEGGFENQEEAIAHLLKEAKSLSSVQHPHIVTVYDAGVDEEGPYVVMELIEGRTLDEMVERGSLTFEDFREVALQTQEALIAAQDLNLVHRDLKPTNVMVTWLPSGRFQMKLVDFGLAKFSPKPSLQTIDHGDAVFGSIHYMAPEQFERAPLDQRTDMYSMGCMYYFALTGLQPFGGETAAEVMGSHLQHSVTPLADLRPDLPAWTCDWVMWHIEREMDKRPSNARESLQKFLMSDQQNPENPEEKTPAQPKRPRLVFPGAEPTPATPAVPGTAESEAAQAPGPPPPAAAPAGVSTGTAPQPIEPPSGQPPSIHTTSQVTASQPSAPAPAEPAPLTPEPPVAAAPTAPVTPPAAATPPPATPAPPVAAAPAPAKLATPPGTINLTGAAQTPPPAAPPVATPGPLPGSPGAVPAPATLISGSTMTSSRKGMSNAIKITLAAVLVVAIIFVGIVVLGTVGKNKETKRANELLAQVENTEARDLATSGDDVRILLRAAISISQNSKREAIYQRLLVAKASDSTDLDAMIAEFPSNMDNAMTPDIRNKLFKVVQGRKSKTSLPFLIDHARTAQPQTATAALQAAEAIAGDDDLAELLSIIQFSSHQQVRQGAKKVIASLARRSENRESLGKALKTAYDSATDEEAKRIFIELLGAAGGDTAAGIVKDALKSKDDKTRLSAMAALGSWADDSEFETLLDYMAEEENDSLRKNAFNFAFQFLKIDRPRDEIDLEDMWKVLAREATLKTEKLKIVTGLASIVDPWAFAVVEFFVEDEDDDVSFKAEQALERMEERRKRINSGGGRDEDDPDEPIEEPAEEKVEEPEGDNEPPPAEEENE